MLCGEHLDEALNIQSTQLELGTGLRCDGLVFHSGGSQWLLMTIIRLISTPKTEHPPYAPLLYEEKFNFNFYCSKTWLNDTKVKYLLVVELREEKKTCRKFCI